MLIFLILYGWIFPFRLSLSSCLSNSSFPPLSPMFQSTPSETEADSISMAAIDACKNVVKCLAVQPGHCDNIFLLHLMRYKEFIRSKSIFKHSRLKFFFHLISTLQIEQCSVETSPPDDAWPYPPIQPHCVQGTLAEKYSGRSSIIFKQVFWI